MALHPWAVETGSWRGASGYQNALSRLMSRRDRQLVRPVPQAIRLRMRVSSANALSSSVRVKTNSSLRVEAGVALPEQDLAPSSPRLASGVEGPRLPPVTTTNRTSKPESVSATSRISSAVRSVLPSESHQSQDTQRALHLLVGAKRTVGRR